MFPWSPMCSSASVLASLPPRWPKSRSDQNLSRFYVTNLVCKNRISFILPGNSVRGVVGVRASCSLKIFNWLILVLVSVCVVTPCNKLHGGSSSPDECDGTVLSWEIFVFVSSPSCFSSYNSKTQLIIWGKFSHVHFVSEIFLLQKVSE